MLTIKQFHIRQAMKERRLTVLGQPCGLLNRVLTPGHTDNRAISELNEEQQLLDSLINRMTSPASAAPTEMLEALGSQYSRDYTKEYVVVKPIDNNGFYKLNPNHSPDWEKQDSIPIRSADAFAPGKAERKSGKKKGGKK